MEINTFSPSPSLHFQSGSTIKVQRLSRHRSQDALFKQSSTIWNPHKAQQQKILKAIRKSQLFSPDRTQTFVKFNYRNCDPRSINYKQAFQKVLTNKKSKDKSRMYKGSMHINDLWGQKNMQEILGNLPLPNDRFKLLNAYKAGVNMKLKPIKIKIKRSKEN